jgi:hypothetical protein
MHKVASRFATIVQKGGSEGNTPKTTEGLAGVKQQCVAYHSSFGCIHDQKVPIMEVSPVLANQLSPNFFNSLDNNLSPANSDSSGSAAFPTSWSRLLFSS